MDIWFTGKKKKFGLGTVSIILELHLVKNIYFMDIIFEKFRDMRMKIKMLFCLTSACSLKEKVGFLTALTIPGKTIAHKIGNKTLFNNSYITTFALPKEPSVPHVAVTITKWKHSDFRVKVQALRIIDNGPFFQRCSKVLHMNINYRILTWRTASLSSSDSLFIAAFLRFSWIYLSYSSWAFFTSSFRLHIYSGVTP